MIMDTKLSKKDPTPFGVKSHRARQHLVPCLGAFKKTIALPCVQAFDKVQLPSKYKRLLEEERLRKWVDYVAKDSSVTAQVYFRRLGIVCK